MKKIFYLLLGIVVLTSCTKEKIDEDYKKSVTPGKIGRYEGYVSPYIVLSRNDNASGPLYDTIYYSDWRDVYEDEGNLVDVDGFSKLSGSTWVITDYWNGGHIHEQPNDTIHFDDAHHYTLTNANTGANYSETYDLIPNVDGLSLTFRLQNIATFGYSGSWSGILPWHSVEQNEFVVQKFSNELNTSEFVRTVKFKKI